MSHSPAVNKPAPHIDDVPPKRSRDFADLTHAFFALVLGIGVILFSVYLHGTRPAWNPTFIPPAAWSAG